MQSTISRMIACIYINNIYTNAQQLMKYNKVLSATTHVPHEPYSHWLLNYTEIFKTT